MKLTILIKGRKVNALGTYRSIRCPTPPYSCFKHSSPSQQALNLGSPKTWRINILQIFIFFF